jgi:serine protease AprX
MVLWQTEFEPNGDDPVAKDPKPREPRGKRPTQKPGEISDSTLEQFPIPAALVDQILLGAADDRRVLQDSPVLGDVWLAYAADPSSIQDLLVTPHKQATAAEVADHISKGLKMIGRGPDRQRGAKIAYLQGITATQLYFDEVLRILVPLTQWWQRQKVDERLDDGRRQLIRSRMRAILVPAQRRAATPYTPAAVWDFSALDRYIALAGLILWVAKQTRPENGFRPLELAEVFKKYESKIDEIVDTVLNLYESFQADSQALAKDRKDELDGRRDYIFQISLNRHALPALDKSVPAVKADAARTLFDIKCDRIVWAVLDSGIDSSHKAFNTPKPRVRKTFDFTNIREIISSDNADRSDAELDEFLNKLVAHNNIDRKDARDRVRKVASDASEKRPTDWDTVEKLITLSNPPAPVSLHGTHVAGIIGAAPVDTNPGGMCHDIRLYDFRVLGKTIDDTEFAVIAALQYIRYINERYSDITIQGANLSLSIPHDVRNYACGRTPVCIECERLVDNGVVVVAAAGNRGHQKFETKEGVFESYAAFSITDPGNGDGVITVGATHGNWPHTYGISFFSSRGPTGDGRPKPDLVAPGERVQSTVPGSEWSSESGTSMAAPHVSGAAAMLMARYRELIGQPRRIKRILCETATDLGRERSFQGHGMLDVLRALQSI